jgi:hypothetical protein
MAHCGCCNLGPPLPPCLRTMFKKFHIAPIAPLVLTNSSVWSTQTAGAVPNAKQEPGMDARPTTP